MTGWSHDELVVELVSRHRCHTIILYGSYADGSHAQESDIDVICFTDQGEAYADARLWNGIFLDGWIYPVSVMDDVENFLHIAGGKILKQKDDRAADFLQRIDKHLSQGPKIPNQKDLEHFRIWAEKMLGRMEKGDPEANYRSHWLLKDLLPHYFDCRGRWYLGPKKSFAWLRENDPDIYERLAAAYSPEAGIDVIRRAARAVCNSTADIPNQ